MENTPNKLISDVCAKIASGYNFGGWTDPLDEGPLGPNEFRASSQAKKKKFKLMQNQQTAVDRFLATSGRRKLDARIKDNRAKNNTLRNR